MRAWGMLLLKYGIGLGLIAWMIANQWEIDRDGENVGISSLAHRTIDFGVLFAAWSITLVAELLTFWRWHKLVRALDLPFRLHDAVRLGFTGLFFGIFLPGAVGGDLMKAAFLAREQTRRSAAVASVLVDRIVGLAGLFGLVVIAGWLLPWFAWTTTEELSENASKLIRGIYWGALAVMVGLAVGSAVMILVADTVFHRLVALLARIPRLGSRLVEVCNALHTYRRNPGVILIAFGISIVSHALFVLAFYLAALALFSREAIPDVFTHLLTVPIGKLVQAGFPTPNGLGGGEAAFAFLYREMGSVASHALLATLATRVLEWSWATLGYLLLARRDAT